MSRRVGRRPRVVVDTGVVVSAFAFGGVPQRALEEVPRSAEVCVAPEPMAAYRTVPQALLAARKITAEQFRSLVAGITAFVSEARMLVPAGCQRSVAAFRKSGESLARMRHLIVLAPEAVEDLEALRAADRAAVRDALERWLRHEPTKTSRSRIKRLRGMRRPQYRLRVEDVRIFCDVVEQRVEVLAVVAKSHAAAWLERHGEPGPQASGE